MPWIEMTPDGQPVPYENYPGSHPGYVPDNFDEIYSNSGFVSQPQWDGMGNVVGWTEPPPATDAIIRERMKAIALGGLMGPGTTNGLVGLNTAALAALRNSDSRWNDYLPSDAALIAEANGLVQRQQQMDANTGFDFGNVLLGGAAAGIGGLSGGFGLGSLFNGGGSGGGMWDWVSNLFGGNSSLGEGALSLSEFSANAGVGAPGAAGGASMNLTDYYSMLDEIQASTNGVLPPNPTLSTPFGDIYGSGSDIAKSFLGNPSNLLRLMGGLTGSSGNLDLSKLAGLTATGGTDWGKILGGLIGYGMTDKLADKYFTKASEIADKYKRPWDEWLPIARQMRDDPQGYMNQYWKPMIGQFTEEAARKAAAGGFNNSGSGVNQIADTVTNRSMQSIFNPNYDANLKAAGLYQSPSTAAGIEGDLTSKGLGVVNQANSNLGFAAREATSGLLGGSRQSTDDIYNNIMKTFFS